MRYVMKLKEINLEKDYRDIPQEFIEEIKRYCSDFLRITEFPKYILYRSSRSDTYESRKKYFFKILRKDRRSWLYLKDYFNYFNDHLKDAGFKAIRSNSILCTGDLHQARMYGIPFMIFPKNGFNFTWNEMIMDYVDSNPNKDFDEKNAKEFWEKYGTYYKDDNLIDAIESGNEILVNADYCYAIKVV